MRGGQADIRTPATRPGSGDSAGMLLMWGLAPGSCPLGQETLAGFTCGI